MKKSLSLILIAGLILIASAIADNGNDLNARYTHMECRANLVSAEAGIEAKYTTVASLDTINADVSQLKGLADSGNTKEFNAFVKGTLTTDFKALQSALKISRAALKQANLTKAQKLEVIDSWKTAVSTFADCNTNAQKQIVHDRKNAVDADISKWNAELQRMKSKNLSTAEAEAVIADADKLSGMLNNALTAGDDAVFKTNLETARQSYLHIWARFNIARLNSYVARIEKQANAQGYSQQISEIKELLMSSATMAAPGKKYADSQFEQTWQNIKSAQDKLNALVQQIKGGSQ